MNQPLLQVENLCKQFKVGKQTIHAVQGISFSLMPGEILGLGGESGCGKSTVGKLLMGLMPPSSGSIFLDGENLQTLSSHHSQAWRQSIQMIFQHPSASLDPRFTVERALSEPFIIHGLAKGAARSEQIAALLAQVGLSEGYLERLPHELSGGQKQRVAIARALAVNPRLLICDEPFSALDVSVQAQIINLLSGLQREKQLSYLIISHDLSILRYLSQRMAIMYAGQFMELGPSAAVYSNPLHPYSQALVSAVLSADPGVERNRSRVAIKGEVPSRLKISQGCPFFSRCPHAQNICKTTMPEWREIKPQHFAACHFLHQE